MTWLHNLWLTLNHPAYLLVNRKEASEHARQMHASGLGALNSESA